MQPGLYLPLWVSLRVKLGVLPQCSGESLCRCGPDAPPVPLHSRDHDMKYDHTPHTQAHRRLSKIAAPATCTGLLLFSLIIECVLTPRESLRRRCSLPGFFKTIIAFIRSVKEFQRCHLYHILPCSIWDSAGFWIWARLPNVKHGILEYKCFYLCLLLVQQRLRDSKPARYQVLFSF